MTVETLLISVLLLLPGAHARQTALRATPIPWSSSYRSTLQELIEVLSYAVVNAVVTVSALAAIAVAFFGRADDLRQLLTLGPVSFAPERRLDGFVWGATYLLVALLVAEVTGSAQVWTRTRTYLAELFSYSDTWTHSTIWYQAIEAARELDPNDEVSVRVRLKDGTEYLGVLNEYPVVEDDKHKDFSLATAYRRTRYADTFEPVTPATHVLISSEECVSIQLGPNDRPAKPKVLDIRPVVTHGVVWTAFLLAAGATYWRLTELKQDDLVRVLELDALWSGVVALFGLIRLLLKDLLDRWERPKDVQFWWLLAGTAGVLASAALVVGVGIAVLLFVLCAIVALVVLVAIAVKGMAPTTAP